MVRLLIARKGQKLLLLLTLFVFVAMGTACSNNATSTNSLTQEQSFTPETVFETEDQIWKIKYSIRPLSISSSLDQIEFKEIDNTLLDSSVALCSQGVNVETWRGPFETDEVLTGQYMIGSEKNFTYVLCSTTLDGQIQESRGTL